MIETITNVVTLRFPVGNVVSLLQGDYRPCKNCGTCVAISPPESRHLPGQRDRFPLPS